MYFIRLWSRALSLSAPTTGGAGGERREECCARATVGAARAHLTAKEGVYAAKCGEAPRGAWMKIRGTKTAELRKEVARGGQGPRGGVRARMRLETVLLTLHTLSDQFDFLRLY